MYKGKFEAPKGTPRPRRISTPRRIEDTVPARRAPMPIPQKTAAPETQEDFLNSLEAAAKPAAEAAPVSGSDKLVPMETLSLRRTELQPQADAKKAAPTKSAPQAKAKKKKKASKGTIAFYSIYFVCIVLCFAFIAGVLSYLDGWLVSHEKSQPRVQSQEVFDRYFADPDWAAIYDVAGLADTAYEGKEEFVSYMSEKVGDQELRFVATASGDPDKLSKYLVKMGDERIASFTLSAKDGSKTIKQWELSTIEVPVERTQSISVCVGSGQIVYVNGVALGQEHIIRTTVTLAEEYLPEGVHGHSSATYYLDGLLVAPTVEVKDSLGNPVNLTYDDATQQYNAEFAKASFTISDKDRDTVIAAAKVLSEFRIEVKDRTALARHFDKNSEYYKATVGQDTWMQSQLLKSYRFSDPVISEYYVYTDDLFSVHVDMTLFVTRTNGTVKEWDASGTFFFSKRSDGTWIVTDTNKIRLQQEVTKVRLTYMNGSEVVSQELVDAASVQLQPPYVAAPEGKRFVGWYRETVDGSGKTVLSLAFQPDPTTGLAYLGTGVELEPMVLHAHFENEGAQ